MKKNTKNLGQKKIFSKKISSRHTRSWYPHSVPRLGPKNFSSFSSFFTKIHMSPQFDMLNTKMMFFYLTCGVLVILLGIKVPQIHHFLGGRGGPPPRRHPGAPRSPQVSKPTS